MRSETSLSPANSLLLIMDQENGVPPEAMNGGLVAATASCIAIGTLSEFDGETRVMLADEEIHSSKNTAMRLACSSVLVTPLRKIDVCTVHLRRILSLAVSGEKCRVELWANDAAEPDEIHVHAWPLGTSE